MWDRDKTNREGIFELSELIWESQRNDKTRVEMKFKAFSPRKGWQLFL